MRRGNVVVLPLALLLIAFVWLLSERTRRLPGKTPPERDPMPEESLADAPSMKKPDHQATERTIARLPDAADAPAPDKQHAFRFVLTDGKLALEAVESIQGDFRKRRGEMAWEQGMFYCRLLDAENRVLAEETLMAPDYVCMVLDPHTPGADGMPSPVRLSPTGPVVFQVRMAGGESASEMKIYRIQTPRPANPGDEPASGLLATISLAQ